MKRVLFATAALALLAGGAAEAQPSWQSINQRQVRIDQRIDTGLRNGAITRAEAERLRAEFRTIAGLENRYRASNGLDNRERADLDARFNRLAANIRIQRMDGQAGWQSINQRQAVLEQRINGALAARRLTVAEATRLRTEFRAIVAMETRYRATGGLDSRERADLDQRFNALSARIRYEANDNNTWRPQAVNQRQANLDRRIDSGVRSGQISPVEAVRLRTEFRALEALETRYRLNGLTAAERTDLERRFDGLSVRIRLERTDWWQW